MILFLILISNQKGREVHLGEGDDPKEDAACRAMDARRIGGADLALLFSLAYLCGGRTCG